MKLINRFGEIFYEKNEVLITMPFERLQNESAELLEENYRTKIKELGFPDSFIYANSFTVLRDRLQMAFDLEGCVAFHNIHKVKLRDMLPYIYSMIDIAKIDTNILWDRNNFVIDTTEKKVKTLLFEFEDFPLYKKDNNIDGLKETILLALTKNQSLIGKPKRADFIEKTDEVYQFSEDILSSNSIEGIEEVVKGYENQKEHEERIAEHEKQQKAEKNILSKGKSKLAGVFPSKKEKSTEEQLKSNLQEEQKGQSKSKSDSNKNWMDKLTSKKGLIIMGVVVVFMLGFTYIGGNGSASEEEIAQEQLAQNENIKDAYRLYVAGDDKSIEDAYAKLDAIGYENLPDEDKNTLIDWYVEQEKYSKALKTTPDSAYKISDKILEKHNIINNDNESTEDDSDNDNNDSNDNEANEEDIDNAIDELETLSASFKDNNILKFDIAVLEDDYPAMLENSKLSQVNERRGKKIAQSYAIDNQFEELEELIDNYRDQQESYDNIQKYYDRYYEQNLSKEESVDKINQLEADIEGKKDEKDSTDDKDKKKELDKEISDMESDKEEAEKNVEEIEESIKKD